MNKFLTWKTLALVMLAALTLTFCFFIARPSTATNPTYQRMIELGFVDEVKSPAELGLDYLQQRPPELTAGLVDNIRYERDRAATQMTDNIAYAIPLGTNTPFAAGQLRNDDGGTLNAGNFEGVGSVTPAGRPESVTGRDVVEMFTAEANNGGSFASDLDSRETLLADASGSFLQTQRIPVIDLIVRNKRNNRYYLLPKIRVDSFCRDALNAVSNHTYRRHNRDLRNLRILRS